jgi:hypothetical protein
MQETWVKALCAERHAIRDGWEVLLRAARVETPLGHPDMLVFMMDWTLDEIFDELRSPLMRRRGARTGRAAALRQQCPCGRNPLLTYFSSAERILHETLLLAQTGAEECTRLEREMAQAELHEIVREVGQREIGAFCGVCQHRQEIDRSTSEPTLESAAH